MQHEKATAEVDRIMKLQKKLQVDYVKALYAALNTERKLEEISMMIGNDSASSSSAGSIDAATDF